MPEFESTEEEGERLGTTDHQAQDQDVERKQGSANGTNKRPMESDVSEGDRKRTSCLQCMIQSHTVQFLREEIWWSLSEAKPFV